MKKAIFCLLGLLGFIGTPALAADMPVSWAGSAPPPAIWNWGGFYLGGGLGGDWSRYETKLTTVNGPTPLFAPADVGRINALGSPTITTLTGAFGGRLGYNYQVDHWVFGLEGNAWYFRSNKTATSSPGNPFAGVAGGVATFNTTSSMDWVATVAPRLGWSIDRVLLYVTGGAAFGKVSYADSYAAVNAAGLALESTTVSQTRAGWTAGGGLNYGLNGNWVLSVDYQHIDLGYLKTSAPVVAVAAANTATFNFSTLVHTDIFTLGAAYKF
jgi:outer membrane immunogenic protein